MLINFIQLDGSVVAKVFGETHVLRHRKTQGKYSFFLSHDKAAVCCTQTGELLLYSPREKFLFQFTELLFLAGSQVPCKDFCGLSLDIDPSMLVHDVEGILCQNFDKYLASRELVVRKDFAEQLGFRNLRVYIKEEAYAR